MGPAKNAGLKKKKKKDFSNPAAPVSTHTAASLIVLPCPL